MTIAGVHDPLLGGMTCGSLLQQLQQIWDEVGESDEDRDKMLLQLERDCLDVYRQKVDQALVSRTQLLQELADAKSELSGLLAALGERSFIGTPEKTTGTIKEQLAAIAPALEQLWKQKQERIEEFADVQSQIQKICGEISGSLHISDQMETPKLQELAGQLCDLWNLMDTPMEERSLFDHVTCNMSASVDEVTVPGALALDLIEQAEMEVERLDQLKASKMKEIAFKKQAELEEIYARAHIEIDSEAAREKILLLIDSGNVDPSELLADMDNQILKAKEEAFSRKEIMEKVEKWMSACEEESWLEDYNRDENRYNSSRALVDTLVAKTRAWEEERGIPFIYDGVPLLAMLDEYAMLRHDREEDKRRMRDQKRFHEQLATEQETIFGSRPSPNRPLGPKKVVGPRVNGNGTPNRRLSSGAQSVRSANKDGKRDLRPAAPVNYVAIAKEDAASHVSGSEPVPASP
ncbi:microtubule-associated protein 2 [Nymphaea thermarum]|nr:microtubule-associated protein 2 [Nymphaea thermarum]